jgi:hypothetical protein
MIAAAPPLTVAELQRLLRAANPGALLMAPRLLRRVIKEDRDIGGIGLQVPHRRSYTIGRERLLSIVGRAELGVSADQHLPTTILLIARPDQEDLDSEPRGAVLIRYWRLLFHARVHAVLDRHLTEERVSSEHIGERARLLGDAQFDEIRMVLDEERYLLPPADRTTIYVEFAALYLELRSFAPLLVPVYFPGIEDHVSVDTLLAQDVDATALLAETRLDGAPGPILPPAEPIQELLESATEAPSKELCRKLLGRAEKAARVGNLVRAARLRQAAARAASSSEAEAAREGARGALDQLIERFRVALELDDNRSSQWRAGLQPLLEPASQGIWPVEARLLYDVQKVCIDRERIAYAVDVVEWAYSLGERPVKRPLPGQTEVLQLKHLRSAARHAFVARIPDAERQRLIIQLNEAVAQTEERARHTIRTWLAEVLDEVGMRPGNLPERVALNKLTEELLDRVVERGYLNMGDLRDAVSRNSLRLADLSGPSEFFRGDRLIRANRRLPAALGGVYRRGEFYLRWLQRFSSVAFGTAPGRFLVLFVLLPFGGAFLALEGVQHILNPIARIVSPEEAASAERIPSTAAEVEQIEQDEWASEETDVPPEKHRHGRFHFATPTTTMVLGCFLFGLMHVGVFRGLVVHLLVMLSRGLQTLVIDLPASILRLAAVRWVLTSRPAVFFGRYLVRPVLAGLVIGILCRMLGLDAREARVAGGAAFLAGCVLFPSALARDLEEAATDWVARTWQRLSLDLLPALFHFIMSLFKQLIETLDRFLYSVDEWLRFRQGESQWTFVWKLVLGSIWLVISYVIRAYVNLFLEPQTNPIKHFPVVTVSHKLMLPFIRPLLLWQADLLKPYLGLFLAEVVAFLNIGMLPGVFGFLAWELKENWRLYRANQPTTLRPEAIGHHGETMRRLLKPGFHSGTVPKLYKRLRRSERRASRAKDQATARKQRAALHHIEEAVRHFVERELLFLLNCSRSWGKGSLSAGRIELGCTMIRVELRCPELGSESAWIGFVYHTGLLTAAVDRPGWMKHLEGEPLRTLQAALAGWYQMAGVDGGSPITWQAWVEAWERDETPCLAAAPSPLPLCPSEGERGGGEGAARVARRLEGGR